MHQRCRQASNFIEKSTHPFLRPAPCLASLGALSVGYYYLPNIGGVHLIFICPLLLWIKGCSTYIPRYTFVNGVIKNITYSGRCYKPFFVEIGTDFAKMKEF